MSIFSLYNTAYTGLYVNQAALTVISQNLANVDTTGYSRKQLVSTEVVSGSTGTGVSISEVKRARDTLLDTTYRTQNSTTEYLSTKSGIVDYITDIVDDISTDDSTGVLTSLEDFFNAWSNLSTDPTSQTYRSSLVTAANDLIENLSDFDDNLQTLQESLVDSAGSMVDEINDIASQLADLNKKIVAAEATGGEASDLRDSRDELLDELSSYTSITTQELDDGSVTVYIGGSAVVIGDNARELSVTGDGSTDNPLTVEWADSGKTVNITDGSLKAILEEADQSGYTDITDTSSYNLTTSSTNLITTMRQALNDLVTTLATAINSLHSTGTGNDSASTTGLSFFVAVDSSEPLSLSNIEVNPELSEDVWKIAAGTSGDSDGTIATEIYSLFDETEDGSDIYQFNGLSKNITQFYSALTTWLGTEGTSYSTSYDTADATLTSIDSQRQEVYSVSLDEEMSKMIKYQNAYGAAAMVMNTVNTLVGNMIDELGSRAGV